MLRRRRETEEYLKNRDNEMGVLRARKIEQTTASKSRSDYLLEITFLFPLSLVAVEGNEKKRERGEQGERRERQRARECYLISKPCTLHG